MEGRGKINSKFSSCVKRKKLGKLDHAVVNISCGGVCPLLFLVNLFSQLSFFAWAFKPNGVLGDGSCPFCAVEEGVGYGDGGGEGRAT